MQPRRVIEDLRELDRRTGGPGGARRVCWTDEWQAARAFLRQRLDELPVTVELDAAGNLWAVLAGASQEMVVVGSHLDSVPGGGWLDGALGVFAAVEVLRTFAEGGTAPGRTVALVDWVDEEGARFGRSLLGSSAFAGTLDAAAVRGLTDADGVTLADALAAFDVDVETMNTAGDTRRAQLAAYLELHIEQGPVLEGEGLACGAVLGTFGVERLRAVFSGQARHAGSTPMDRRRDAGVAAARAVVGLQAIGLDHGGVCTGGAVELEPGIVTAVPGRAELLIDQRHLDADALASMLADAYALLERSAAVEGCTVAVEPIWRIAPVPFHGRLIEAAAQACRAETGVERRLPSGALHDAAELARVCPTAMVFSSSVGGVSHAPDEDTPEADLERAIAAFGLLAAKVVAEDVG